MKELKYDEKTSFGGTWHYRGKINSPVSSVIQSVYVRKFCMEHVLFLVVTGLFIILDAFLLIKWMHASLNKNRKTIASIILSGAGMNDLRMICIIENIMLCLFSFLLSIPFIILICGCLNRMCFCQYFVFDFMNLVLLLFSVLCVSIASLFILCFQKKI